MNNYSVDKYCYIKNQRFFDISSTNLLEQLIVCKR